MRLSSSLARSCLGFILPTTILLAGCGDSTMKLETARTQVAAEAAGSKLPGAALERWLLAAQVAPSPIVSGGLVSAWINTTLLIDAIRHHGALDDSATVDAVILPDAEKGMIAQFFEARHLKRAPVTDAQADSLYDTERVRVFQQILIRVVGKPDSLEAKRIVARGRGLLVQLHNGVDFTSTVKQASEDSASRAHDGYLPAMSRDVVPQYFVPIWELRPGEISELLASPVGGHIIRRAKREESREALKVWLAPRLAQRADSMFVDSVARAGRFKIAADARDRLRKMAVEPGRLADGGPMVTWKGGQLEAPRVLSALLMLQPKDRLSLVNASDTIASQYLLGLSRAHILIPVVGDQPPPNAAARAVLVPMYRRTLDSLRAAVGRMPATATAGEAAIVFIDSIFAGKARYLPLPGALASVLRARSPVSVNAAVVDGLVRGVGPKWVEAHKNDKPRGGRAGAADSNAVPQI